MKSKQKLYARLLALENSMINPMQQRIEQLSDADRNQYEMWKQACKQYYAQHETTPGGYFNSLINGDLQRPSMSIQLERVLFPDEIHIKETDSEDDAADKYRLATERK